jgi:5-methylcytosine-specific restriction endonuclease McrA
MTTTQKKRRLRSKADELWRKACLQKYGKRCELCEGTYNTTPHHFFYKSSFGHLRYDIANGVILCQKCHAKLHFQDPKLMEAEIIKKRGRKWHNRLMKRARNRPEGSYKTVGYYQNIINQLNGS